VVSERFGCAYSDSRQLAELENSLLGFQRYHGQIAKPFEWKFTRDDLKRLLRKAADAKVAPSRRVA